jgi:replicative DNA helicase
MGKEQERLDADEIKRAVDIVDVIGHYVELHRAGKEYEACCPFHKEATPSFKVNPEAQLYNCFGCQSGGDVFTFLVKHEGITFSEAVSRAAELGGLTLPGAAPQAHVAGPVANRAQPKPPSGTIVAVYPYVDEQGELLYEVCRLEPKSFRQRRPDGCGGYTWDMDRVRRVLYRLPVVLKVDSVFLVEGEKDVDSLEAQGAVATTNSGGASQKWQPEWTSALAGKTVIVIPDNDEPGRRRADLIVKELSGRADVVKVVLPDGKDVSEYFERGHTFDELLALVRQARRDARRDELQRRGLLDPTEIIECADGGLNALLDPSSRASGLDTGFKRLQRMTLGLHPGELWILAARPSAGKTALAMDIAANVAGTGKAVAVFELEMSAEALLARIVCNRARVDSLKYRMGALDAEERQRVQRALYAITELPLFIDDASGVTLASIRDKLLALRSRRGLDLVIIDYLQLMGSDRRENRNQEVSVLSRGLKLMARELRVPFLVLSQLSRASETRPGDHKPQLSDLRDSGSIEQDADLVAFIYREELYKPDREDLKGIADLLIAKQRQGPIGRVPLTFVSGYTRFEARAEAVE